MLFVDALCHACSGCVWATCQSLKARARRSSYAWCVPARHLPHGGSNVQHNCGGSAKLAWVCEDHVCRDSTPEDEQHPEVLYR